MEEIASSSSTEKIYVKWKHGCAAASQHEKTWTLQTELGKASSFLQE